jgi:poly(3-hydroxybutyrate) depolymerase
MFDEGVVSDSMQSHVLEATIHGRYLVEPPAGHGPSPMLVGFHGYAERAEHMLDALRSIRADRPWLLVSVQALNRFYTRANDVVANWMTREDRHLMIDDNIGYVAAVVAAVRREYACSDALVYAGFSQGVAMAYRASAFAAERRETVPRPAGAIVLAGDVPPDVQPRLALLPPVLVGRGVKDQWYTEEKAAADLALFAAAGIAPLAHVFDDGHVWHESFVHVAGGFLDRILQAQASPLSLRRD